MYTIWHSDCNKSFLTNELRLKVFAFDIKNLGNESSL